MELRIASNALFVSVDTPAYREGSATSVEYDETQLRTLAPARHTERASNDKLEALRKTQRCSNARRK